MRLLASGFVCVATSVSFERHVEGVSRWLTSIVQTNGDVSTIDGGVKDGLQLESRVQDLPTNPVLRVEKQSGRPLNSSKQAAESRVTEPFTQASPPSAESTSDAATVISNNPSHSPGKPIGFMEREPDARLGEENKGINNALRATVMDRDVVDARHEESSDANGEVVRAPVRQVVKSEVGTQPIVGDQRPVKRAPQTVVGSSLCPGWGARCVCASYQARPCSPDSQYRGCVKRGERQRARNWVGKTNDETEEKKVNKESLTREEAERRWRLSRAARCNPMVSTLHIQPPKIDYRNPHRSTLHFVWAPSFTKGCALQQPRTGGKI